MHAFRCAVCGAITPANDQPASPAACAGCRAALDLSNAPQQVDGPGLASALGGSPVPVLVDFWEPGCSSCRRVAPLLSRLGRERAGRLLVLQVNSEAHPEAAEPYGILCVPTLLLFRGGALRSSQVGSPPAKALARWLDQHLAQG